MLAGEMDATSDASAGAGGGFRGQLLLLRGRA
jgi:hypothetical protein